jgi:hypothetical protein
LTKKAD